MHESFSRVPRIPANLDLGKPGRFVVTVYPEDADRLLVHNTNNRTVRKAAVADLKGMISRREWRNDHPHPIVFDTNRVLADGQHRLLAISQGGTPVVVTIVTGADPQVRQYIDTNQPRRLHDRMEFVDDRVVNRQIAVIINALVLLKRKTQSKTTPEEAKGIFAEYEKSLIWCARLTGARNSRVTRAGACAALVQFHNHDASMAEEFMASLTVPDGDVQQARMLRDFMLRGMRTHSFASVFDDSERTRWCCAQYADGRDVKAVKRMPLWPWEKNT